MIERQPALGATIYGPFDVDAAQTLGDALGARRRCRSAAITCAQSELCATCHTLYHDRARRRTARRSASCRSRCRIRSGCTAISATRRAASPATCRWSTEPAADHVASSACRATALRAPHFRRRQLLHAADAEPLSRRARRSPRCRRSSTPRASTTDFLRSDAAARVAIDGARRSTAGRLARRRRRREPRRPQAADRVSVAPRLAARRRARRRRAAGVRVGRAARRRLDSRATTTTPTRSKFEPHYTEITQRRPGADLRDRSSATRGGARDDRPADRRRAT